MLRLLGYSNDGVAPAFLGRSICDTKSTGGFHDIYIYIYYSLLTGKMMIACLYFILISSEIIVQSRLISDSDIFFSSGAGIVYFSCTASSL
jgi:hypothetical protein